MNSLFFSSTFCYPSIQSKLHQILNLTLRKSTCLKSPPQIDMQNTASKLPGNRTSQANRNSLYISDKQFCYITLSALNQTTASSNKGTIYLFQRYHYLNAFSAQETYSG